MGLLGSQESRMNLTGENTGGKRSDPGASQPSRQPLYPCPWGRQLSVHCNQRLRKWERPLHALPSPERGARCYTHTHMCTHPVIHVPHVHAHTHLHSTHCSFPGVFHFLIGWDWIRRCSLVLLGVICSALSSVQPHLQTPFLPCEMRAPIRLREYSGSSWPSLPQQKKKKKLFAFLHQKLIFSIKEASIIKMQNRKEEGASSNFQSRKNQKCLWSWEKGKWKTSRQKGSLAWSWLDGRVGGKNIKKAE